MRIIMKKLFFSSSAFDFEIVQYLDFDFTQFVYIVYADCKNACRCDFINWRYKVEQSRGSFYKIITRQVCCTFKEEKKNVVAAILKFLPKFKIFDFVKFDDYTICELWKCSKDFSHKMPNAGRRDSLKDEQQDADSINFC